MKIILAPDSFKGSLSSLEVVKVLEISSRQIFPDMETVSVPMADGGEGTIDVLITSAGGFKETVSVTGPLGNKVKAAIGYINDGKTAVLEMAQASGLCLVPNGEKNPLAATSYGTGELLQIVLNKGIRDILIGIGGSATNDGGMGAMKALGVKFLDIEGRELFGSGASLESVQALSAFSRADLL
jgi:glycerate kinase